MSSEILEVFKRAKLSRFGRYVPNYFLANYTKEFLKVIVFVTVLKANGLLVVSGAKRLSVEQNF